MVKLTFFWTKRVRNRKLAAAAEQLRREELAALEAFEAANIARAMTGAQPVARTPAPPTTWVSEAPPEEPAAVTPAVAIPLDALDRQVVESLGSVPVVQSTVAPQPYADQGIAPAAADADYMVGHSSRFVTGIRRRQARREMDSLDDADADDEWGAAQAPAVAVGWRGSNARSAAYLPSSQAAADGDGDGGSDGDGDGDDDELRMVLALSASMGGGGGSVDDGDGYGDGDHDDGPGGDVDWEAAVALLRGMGFSEARCEAAVAVAVADGATTTSEAAGVAAAALLEGGDPD